MNLEENLKPKVIIIDDTKVTKSPISIVEDLNISATISTTDLPLPPKIIIDDDNKLLIPTTTTKTMTDEERFRRQPRPKSNQSQRLVRNVRKPVVEKKSYFTPPLGGTIKIPFKSTNKINMHRGMERGEGIEEENDGRKMRHITTEILIDDDILDYILMYADFNERRQYLNYMLICKNFKSATYRHISSSSRTKEDRLRPPRLFTSNINNNLLDTDMCRQEETRRILRNVYESIIHRPCPLYDESSTYSDFDWPMLNNYILVELQNFIKLSCSSKRATTATTKTITTTTTTTTTAATTSSFFNASDAYDVAYIFIYEFAKDIAMKMWNIILEFPESNHKDYNMSSLLRTWYQWKGVNKTIREINRYISSYYAHHYCFPVIRLKQVSLSALSSHLSRGFVVNGAKESLNEYMGYVFHIQLCSNNNNTLQKLLPSHSSSNEDYDYDIDNTSSKAEGTTEASSTVITNASSTNTTTTPLEIEQYYSNRTSSSSIHTTKHNNKYNNNNDTDDTVNIMEALLFINKLQKNNIWNNTIALV